MLLQALVSALIAAGVSPPVAILLVAGGTAAIGLVLFLMGQKRLEPTTLAPGSHDRFLVGRQAAWSRRHCHDRHPPIFSAEADAARVGLADTLPASCATAWRRRRCPARRLRLPRTQGPFAGQVAERAGPRQPGAGPADRRGPRRCC